MARPYVIAVASEKGGVGKTTLATNLAIYLKALAEDLPVTLISFDNHFTVDQMFQLGKPDKKHHVGQLFTGENPEDLISVGQYGVQFIPSSRDLIDFQKYVQSVEHLAQMISQSSLQGILIIDTSPVLDIYTRNALYVADRIIVPIKDAPSLENCSHLAEFLVQHQRVKSILKILPCLVDTRIHFSGPFRNSYQLLKAYAINRGYRCFEGFIAKSPKVESLATNPEGKIYPVITHGRSTEVHLQLTHLTRQVYLDYLEQGPIRLNEVANTLFERTELREQEYKSRTAGLQPSCLCCENPLPENRIWSNAYFIGNANGSFYGYMEEDCFFELLLQDCYPELSSKGQQQLLREMLTTSGGGSFYLLLQKNQIDSERAQIDLYRLDRQGEKISGRSSLIKERGRFQRRGKISMLQLFDKAAMGHAQKEQLLLVRRMGETPLEILQHLPYLEWQAIFNRVQIDHLSEAGTAKADVAD